MYSLTPSGFPEGVKEKWSGRCGARNRVMIRGDDFMKNDKLKPCPFCGGKVKQAEGIGGLLFFTCTNYKNCGAMISFDNAICNRFPKAAVIKYNKRAGEQE